MITYIIGQANSAFVTVSERVTISNPFYLWVIEDSQNRIVDQIAIIENTSASDRFDEFLLSFDLKRGRYKYTIYQKNTNDTSFDDTTPVLEIGLLQANE